jgi:hypothetical protein
VRCLLYLAKEGEIFTQDVSVHNSNDGIHVFHLLGANAIEKVVEVLQ